MSSPGPATCSSTLAPGFAAAPTPFTVPAPRCQVDFNEPAQGSEVAYSTLDLTADDHPDLVVFKDQCDATIGQTHWDLYPWSASGFAGAPLPFKVPAPRCQVSFDEAAQDAAVTYATVDLTGDGHPDLVAFSDQCDASVGQTHWDLYAWSASGFAAAPVPFAVPAPRCQVDFDKASHDDSISYAMMDLTGDGTSDLVVFGDHCDATVGQTHWDVYAGSASGFAAAPVPFAIPAPRCQIDFDEAAQDAAMSYSTMDLTADGHPDLVVFSDQCDASVGQTHWDLYPWSAAGFAAAPVPFTVPAPRCQISFDEASQDATIAYAAMDLTGDGNPELVVFGDRCDTSTGQTHWDVYPWSTSGFAAAPTPFALPAPRCQIDFDEAAQDAAISYSTMALTAACGVDLVVFGDQCDATVGQTHWDVYGAQ